MNESLAFSVASIKFEISLTMTCHETLLTLQVQTQGETEHITYNVWWCSNRSRQYYEVLSIF
jgi:hypothetical protein